MGRLRNNYKKRLKVYCELKKIFYFSVLVFVLLVVSISGFAWKQYQAFLTTSMQINDENGLVYTVNRGANIASISNDLIEKQLTAFPALYLELFARLHDKATQIKAGEYLLYQGMTLPGFLETIISGKVVQHRYTVVEGMTSQQLLSSLAENENLKSTIGTLSDQELLSAIGTEFPHLEGLFLPETYLFPANTTDLEFLKRAYNSLDTYLNQAWLNKAENLPYESPYEALIMASIIEKETGIAEERTEIAGVFVRRLEKGMRLQTDPTVIYGIGENYDGNIRRKDLRTDTPYNTYTRHGLPPTPIALASKESIYAALHPKDGNSLYFVATGKDGRHYFSSTLREHNNAVRKYQLKK
jgi:UPF0755 protein